MITACILVALAGLLALGLALIALGVARYRAERWAEQQGADQ